jgi:ketosteroid isomerase-like protein
MDVDAKVQFLERAYERFNGREIDDLLAMMTDDVEWPDVARAKVLRGKAAIRPYWEAQFAVADPRVTPTAYIPTGEDIVAVVDQQVFDLDGKAMHPATVVYHRYAFDGKLVRRMQAYDDRNDAVLPRD